MWYWSYHPLRLSVSKRMELALYDKPVPLHMYTKISFHQYLLCVLQAYNLGTGVGYSVIDMVKAFEKASGRTVSSMIIYFFLVLLQIVISNMNQTSLF